MTKHRMLVSIAAVALIVLAVIITAAARVRQTRALQERLTVLELKKAQTASISVNRETLRKAFPPHGFVPAYIEGLYLLSQETGLRNVDITTLPDTRVKPPSHASPQAARLITYTIRIACDSDYRSIARYFRGIHRMERYKRITQFEMKPVGNAIHTTLTLEIMALED